MSENFAVWSILDLSKMRVIKESELYEAALHKALEFVTLSIL